MRCIDHGHMCLEKGTEAACRRVKNYQILLRAGDPGVDQFGLVLRREDAEHGLRFEPFETVDGRYLDKA